PWSAHLDRLVDRTDPQLEIDLGLRARVESEVDDALLETLRRRRDLVVAGKKIGSGVESFAIRGYRAHDSGGSVGKNQQRPRNRTGGRVGHRAGNAASRNLRA